MRADYLKIKSAYLEHATRAGMPSNVPSYYRGTGPVSAKTVNERAGYNAYNDFKQKYDKLSMELAVKKGELIKAKQAKKLADSIPTIEKEITDLTARAQQYKTWMENAAKNNDYKKDVDNVQAKRNTAINTAKEVGRFMSKSFVSGQGNVVKGMATTLLNENDTYHKVSTLGGKYATPLSPNNSRKGDTVANLFFGRKKNKRY